MNDNLLLSAFLAEHFPSIQESHITDEFMRDVWLKQAKAWYKRKNASGFNLALVEFRKLQGTRHYSRETTLKHALEAFRKAGMI